MWQLTNDGMYHLGIGFQCFWKHMSWTIKSMSSQISDCFLPILGISHQLQVKHDDLVNVDYFH
jgi:hypothetical protein